MDRGTSQANSSPTKYYMSSFLNPPSTDSRYSKSRVPDTFQLGAISAFLEFCASSKINNLRVFNARNIPTPPASTIVTRAKLLAAHVDWRGCKQPVAGAGSKASSKKNA